MKHTKLICFCLSALLLALPLFGCRKTPAAVGNSNLDAAKDQAVKQNYTVASYDAYALEEEERFEKELGIAEDVLYDAYCKDETAPPEMSVTFNGESYTGKYRCTYSTGGWPFLLHRYNGDNAWFSVKEGTNELVSFTKLVKASPLEISQEQAREIADAFVSQYIDISNSEYTVEVSYASATAFGIQYVRYISGYKTLDAAALFIDGKGEVTQLVLYDPGSFADINSVTVDNEQIDRVIEAKLDERFENWVAYDKRNAWLVRLPNGLCAICHRIDVQYDMEYIEDPEYGLLEAPKHKTINVTVVTTPGT